MTITFIGHGYVGLVSAAVFADLGNTVYVIGHTSEKVENLKKGIIPIYEPGLEELVKRNITARRLIFTLDYEPAVANSDVIFIAVGTPPKETGEADLSVVYDVSEKAAKYLKNYTVVIIKSTVPVGTNRNVKERIQKLKPHDATFDIASVPEFLREGQAISDTLRPDRIVIGTETKKARELLLELHKGIDAQAVITNIESAEMIKYASNAFLAMKISFANAIAQLSEVTGADGRAVLEAVGLDKRIGGSFLQSGAGYGGSCFPKDVKALIAIAKQYGYDFALLKNVEEINQKAMERIIEKVEKMLEGAVSKKRVAVLGLAFKPDTDDMRDAPAIPIIRVLGKLGAKVAIYDPVAMENAKRLLTDVQNCLFVESAYEAVKDADLLIIVTEWNEFKQLDLEKMKKLMRHPRVVDGRNIYDPKEMHDLGFTYLGVG